jgi:phenylalanyl-tRNA synthetase beta subunit
VARIYGYENIQSREVTRENTRVINKEYFYSNKISSFLIKNGFSEIFTYVLQDRGEVEIRNPIASDRGFMRDTLLIGTQNSLKLNLHNIGLLGLDEIKTFEIGKIFKEGNEYISLAIAFLNPNIKKNKNEENLIEVVKSLGQELGLELSVDMVDQSIVEINISKILEKLPEPNGDYDLCLEKSNVVYKPFSIYPFILRDIAVWVPETVSKEELLSLIKENAGELLVKDRLFDEFKKEGRVSYAFRLVFQSFEKTLTDVEVNEVMKVIESKIKEKGWEVR